MRDTVTATAQVELVAAASINLVFIVPLNNQYTRINAAFEATGSLIIIVILFSSSLLARTFSVTIFFLKY